jgi:hypothetical protein
MDGTGGDSFHLLDLRTPNRINPLREDISYIHLARALMRAGIDEMSGGVMDLF